MNSTQAISNITIVLIISAFCSLFYLLDFICKIKQKIFLPIIGGLSLILLFLSLLSGILAYGRLIYNLLHNSVIDIENYACNQWILLIIGELLLMIFCIYNMYRND
uniref:Uncharacterized protein n=1 Tax=viral metagenome TaxID=1070528 RepID=A0A6M3LLL0_9ZZZZ